MAFPDTPLDVRAELLLLNTWTDVSAYLDHGPISIGRGHPDESTTVSPSTLSVTFTNTDARFSSKNPTSPYYPYLVRNVQCRISVPSDQAYLRLEQSRAAWASCPYASALGITGDLDVRIDLQLTDLAGGVVAGMWGASGSFAWLLQMDPGGWPRLYWSTTGSDFPSALATARLPQGRIALRATLAVASGTVTFYTSPAGGADAGPWTQLGSAVVTGATSVHAATGTPLAVGDAVGSGSGLAGMQGRVYEFELRNGIGGTIVAHPVFSGQSPGVTSFSDGHSNTWTGFGTVPTTTAEISNRDYRAHAEVPEWPQHQDPTGKTWLVNAKGGGLLRRLSQRNNAVNSAMWRAWVKTGVDLAGFWPFEDGPGAQSLASGIGGPAAQFSGALQLASNSDFLCSAPLPVLNGTVIVGQVPAYPYGAWQGNQVSWLMEIPAAGEPNGAEILRFSTSGTIAQVVVTYGTGGTMTIQFLSASGSSLGSTGALAFEANGQPFLCVVSLTPDGSGGINWAFEAVAPGASFGGATGNIASASIGAVTAWTLNGGGQLLQTVVGHVAVQAAPSLFDVTAYGQPLNAWQGEAAGNRFRRLCQEEGIQYRIGGDPGATILMGAQSQQTLVQLLQECADASRSVWYELRQQLGFGFIPPGGLYNQAAAVAVTYSADDLSEWASDPTEDDQAIKNDMTVSQTTGGASARQYAAPGQAINGGRLSTQAPPAGAGTYDDSQSYNAWQASDLPSLASWIVHVGTVDEPRYPGLVIDLSNRALASVFYQVLALELGQRLTVSAPPAQDGPDTISQLAQQLDEELWGDTFRITMAGVPSRPWLVAADGASTGRADTDGSTLAAGVTSSATTLSVATASGFPLWATSGAVPFDIGVAGERMTVTAISGGSSPQSFTVTRSVNGVVKAQSSSAVLALWDTPAGAL